MRPGTEERTELVKVRRGLERAHEFARVAEDMLATIDKLAASIEEDRVKFWRAYTGRDDWERDS